MGLSSRSVSGFQKPGVDAPSPSNGLSDTTTSHRGMMMKANSISEAWNTSVRETARKPPMKV